MAEICYAELVPMSEIVGIIENLVKEGLKNYLDFGKVALIFCGLQHKIYSND